MVKQIIETGINLGQINDQVAMLLHAHKVIPDSMEIQDIEYGDPDKDGVIPLKVHVMKEQEVSK